MNSRRELTFGVGLWMFGQFIDRYATDAYGPPVGVLEAIDRAGQVGELVAIDINYPFDEGVTADQVRMALERNRLRCYAITPASYSRKFQKGALTNPDSQLRREAIDLYKSSIPVARELAAKYVKFWPGQDGYDYPFQADYEALWLPYGNSMRCSTGWILRSPSCTGAAGCARDTASDSGPFPRALMRTVTLARVSQETVHWNP